MFEGLEVRCAPHINHIPLRQLAPVVALKLALHVLKMLLGLIGHFYRNYISTVFNRLAHNFPPVVFSLLQPFYFSTYHQLVSKSNTANTQGKRIKPEQRKVVQVTLRPAVYQIALDEAAQNDTFPGRVIEVALLKLAADANHQNKDRG